MKKLIFLIFIFICFLSFSLKPSKLYISHPDSLALKSESFRILTTDGLTLQAWVLHPLAELNLKTSIILAYGDAGNMSYWLEHAAVLSKRGFTVIMFDYRGFGESSAFEMNENQLYYQEFTQDLTSVFLWTKSHIDNEKIGIWGLSMGTIMTGFLIKENTVDFLILEGLVINPQDIKVKILAAKGKVIDLPKNAEKLSEIYKQTTIPMLIFSGEDDQFTTVFDANKMANFRQNRKSIVFKGGHLQGFSSMTNEFFGDKYVLEIEKFISSK